VADIKFYADCIRKGDDPESVLRVALTEQRDHDARVAERLYPLGSQVLGDAPQRISLAIRGELGRAENSGHGPWCHHRSCHHWFEPQCGPDCDGSEPHEMGVEYGPDDIADGRTF
jgi:hypothetical protein